MLGLVKPLREGEQAPLERGREPFHTHSEALQGRDTMLGLKLLGEGNEALLQRGCNPSYAHSKALQGLSTMPGLV
ncbi:hypothetical protein ABIB82_007637 [Bradyrhizobium sp. i1.8.4]